MRTATTPTALSTSLRVPLRYGCRRVILTAAAESDPHYAELKTALCERPETELSYMGAGDVYGNFTCLWPRRDALPDTVNEQSLILLFRANGKRCLFTGDAGNGERREVALGTQHART